ncbi:MAG: DUF3307 domain-containing protein [Rickettsia conorii subsp. raoultii]|uniref:DUF3307 domain-containing protein n=1 Tax=Rickettsia conorii TaxID=781 RepID=UPI003AF1E16D
MSEKESIPKNRLDFLYKAIDDTQQTIRFTDAKAGAVVGFWTLFLTLTLRNYESVYSLLISHTLLIEKLLIIAFLLVLGYFFCNSLLMAYLTLVPKINPKAHINSEDFSVDDLFFLWETNQPVAGKYLYSSLDDLKMKISAKEYRDKFLEFDSSKIEQSLIVELLKVSFIRNLKLTRTNVAITSVINSLLTILLLTLFLIGEKIFPFKGEVNLDSINLNVSLFIILYIGHKIADYLFQTDYQALNKHKNWGALLRHCLIYTITLTFLAFIIIGYFSWTTLFIIFISHIIIDKRVFVIWWATKIKKMSNTTNIAVQPAIKELDQSFHYIILFIVSLI